MTPKWELFNEIKKDLWVAKEQIKTLKADISTGDLPADADQRLECAIHSLSLVGARLRELERS